MTMTDMPRKPKPQFGFARLRELTGASSDLEAANVAIRRMEQLQSAVSSDSFSESDKDHNSRLISVLMKKPPIRSDLSLSGILDAIEEGRKEQFSAITRNLVAQ